MCVDAGGVLNPLELDEISKEARRKVVGRMVDAFCGQAEELRVPVRSHSSVMDAVRSVL